MRTFVATGLFVLCASGAFAQGEVARVVEDQVRLNQAWQQRFVPFASPDSLPTFAPRLPSLQRTVQLQAPSLPSVNLPSLGTNAFGLQLPSPNLRSPAASLRLDGLNPFGGSSFSTSLPQFGVGGLGGGLSGVTTGVNTLSNLQNLNAGSVLGMIPGAGRAIGSVTGRSLFGNQREGEHSSPSLPFLDSSDAENLTYKIEAVKIIEHTLKKLKDSAPGAAGGFQMMGFLFKLVQRVAKRQKGMVAAILVLVTVPYAATLATTWMSGPTTAMEIIWPMAKKAIVALGMKLLKKLGRKRADAAETEAGFAESTQDPEHDFQDRVRELEGLSAEARAELEELAGLERGSTRPVEGREGDDAPIRRDGGGAGSLPASAPRGAAPGLRTDRVRDVLQERVYGGSLTPRIPALVR
ncbi:MAG: hypothetical protein R3F62_21990 [Planctomycetota bacterium]